MILNAPLCIPNWLPDVDSDLHIDNEGINISAIK